MTDLGDKEGPDPTWTVSEGNTMSLGDLLTIVSDIATKNGPAPNVMPMSRAAFRVVDKARVRWGFMPMGVEGERYAQRRRRMARKKRRGWA